MSKIPAQIPIPMLGRSFKSVLEEIERRKAQKKEVKQVLAATSPGQIPATVTPGPNILMPPAKKSGLGLALLIVGGGLFVFWGIPLLQGKGGFVPGISKPLGYTPTRKSPGTAGE